MNLEIILAEGEGFHTEFKESLSRIDNVELVRIIYKFDYSYFVLLMPVVNDCLTLDVHTKGIE